MAYSQKYTLVSFLAPTDVGAQFHMADWPLHVTLADVFAIDREGSGIDGKLAKLLAGQAQVSSHAGDDATLGMTAVTLVEKTDALAALHMSLVDLLEANGAVFNTPEFVREGFLPHVTVQKVGRVYKGDEVAVTAVALIDMFPGGDWRQRKVLRVLL